MEAHLVHYNEKYGNFEQAVTKKDGLAVVALFIQALGDRDCDFFRKITDQIDKIRQPNAKCELQSGKIHLSELFPLAQFRHYLFKSIPRAVMKSSATKYSFNRFFQLNLCFSRLFGVDNIAGAQ